MLGLFPDVEYEDGNIDLRPGDLLVAFTDGVTEARNAERRGVRGRAVEGFTAGGGGASAEEISSTLADGSGSGLPGRSSMTM